MPRLAAIFPILLLVSCAGPMAGDPEGTRRVTVGIIAINDFHGHLEPPRQAIAVPDGKGGSVPVPAGGAAWLASAIDSLRAKYPYHAVVSAGDLIGASPITSALFLDEPAIGAMNRMGLDFNAVGNHEFDRGRAELLRMQRGGCAMHTLRRPCQVERFKGARFGFLAASTFTEQGKTLFPATGIRRFGKGRARVSVGFIGLTLRDTPRLVSPDGVQGLTFTDEAEAINRSTAQLRKQGADAVVVLIHQGGRTDGPPDPDSCNALSGEILPILAKLDPRVDAVVSGHTHQAHVCELARPGEPPLLLTSAGLYGELVTDIALEIDPEAKRVVARRANNIIVQSQPYVAPRGTVANSALRPQFAPRPDIAAYVQRYTDAAAGLALRPAGRLSGPAPRQDGPMGGPLGNLIADAQLAATAPAGAQIAFTNPFGIRASLDPAPGGMLTFGQLHAVQPFNNLLTTQTLTGVEIAAALEQGVDDTGPLQLLAASAGFAYSYDRSRPAGQRITGVKLNGAPLTPDASYRVTTNSFLAMGGDGFTVLARRREAAVGMTDIEALERWLTTGPMRAVPSEQRIVGR